MYSVIHCHRSSYRTSDTRALNLMECSGNIQILVFFELFLHMCEKNSTFVDLFGKLYHMRNICRYICLLIGVLVTSLAHAHNVRIYGYVLGTDNRGVELANVYVEGTTIGTSTNQNGYYDLMVEQSDTIVLVYSMIGYETIRQQLYTENKVLGVNVVLPTNEEMLSEITVRGIQRQTGTMERTDVDVARLMPDATGGGIENLLITFAGVRQNNEMSSQYNVRGGSYDENSVYVNGLEVYRPLLIRSGQQEGLSFANTDMVESVDFSAGGFDAQYGDRMSSVLDIRYKRPEKLESRLNISLLGASAYIGWGDSVQSQMHGIRYKTSKYMLGALETKGNYKPNFIDYQTQMTWKVGKEAKDWEIRLMGNFSQNSYLFNPDSATTTSGTLQNPITKQIYFEGQEKDMFRTAFAALSAYGKVNKEVEVGVDLSGFYTHEQETYDIHSELILTRGDKNSSQDSNNNLNQSITGSTEKQDVIGTGEFHEHARNKLQASIITLAHTGEWKRGQNSLKWGVSGQVEMMKDQISEWEWRDSLGYSLPNVDKEMELYYAMKGTTQMLSGRLQAYAQNTYRWSTDQGKVFLTAGMRLNWWSFTNEVLPSPRVSVVWMPGWKRDMTFRVATGIYYQAPFYKELRQTIIDDKGVYRIHLNDKLKAQRSYQLVMGTDYYFRAWGRPFKFTAEAYGKYIDRMESYTVDNVRVRYSGLNDSEGYTLGLDLKLFGELAPGADSWISFSTMRSRMRFVDDVHELGWIPTPQEQRYNLTLYFQDYLPQLPQYKLHLKFIWSEGLPYGYPRNEKMRYLGHMGDYRRVDIGASRTFSASTDKWMKKAKHVDSWSVQFDVFNLVGWNNMNSYYWVTAADGQHWPTPNYLTGRMFNLKIDVKIK